jgi:hypothetical protein
VLNDPTALEGEVLDIFRQLMRAVASLPRRTAAKCEPAANTLAQLALAVGARLAKPRQHDFGEPPGCAVELGLKA